MKAPVSEADRRRRAYYARKRDRKAEAEADAARFRLVVAADALDGLGGGVWSGDANDVPLAPAALRSQTPSLVWSAEDKTDAARRSRARFLANFERPRSARTAARERASEATTGSQNVAHPPFGSHVCNICQRSAAAKICDDCARKSLDFEPGFPDSLKTLPLDQLRAVLTLSPGTWRRLAKRVENSMFSRRADKASREHREALAQAHDDAAWAIADREKWELRTTATGVVHHTWPDGAEIEEHRIASTQYVSDEIEIRDETPAETVARVRQLARRAGYIAKYFQPIRRRHPQEGQRPLTPDEVEALRAPAEVVAAFVAEAQQTKRGRRKVDRRGPRVVSDAEIRASVIAEVGAETGDGEFALEKIAPSLPRNAERIPHHLARWRDIEGIDAAIAHVEKALEDRRRYRTEREFFMHRRRAAKARACEWLAGVHVDGGAPVVHVGGAPFLEANRCESRFCPRCAKAQASRGRRRIEKRLEAACLSGELESRALRFLTLTQEGIPGESLESAKDRLRARLRKLSRSKGWADVVDAALVKIEVTRSTPARRLENARRKLRKAKEDAAFVAERWGVDDETIEQIEHAEAYLKHARSVSGSWWHVHAHALIKLAPGMVTTRRGREIAYWPQADALALWRMTDLRDVDDKRKGGANVLPPRRGLAEVVKYITKPFELAALSSGERRELVEVFAHAHVLQAWGEWQGSNLARLAEGTDPLLQGEIDDAKKAQGDADAGRVHVLDEDEEITADLVTHKTALARRAGADKTVGTRTTYDVDGVAITRAVRREEIEWTRDRKKVDAVRENMNAVHIERLVRASVVAEREMEKRGDEIPRMSFVERAWWDTRPGGRSADGDDVPPAEDKQANAPQGPATAIARIYRMKVRP